MLNKIFQSIDIGAIISERLSAFKKLQENPNDIDAVMALGKVQEKVQAIAFLHLINKNYDFCFKLWEFSSLFNVKNLFNFKENVKGIYTGIWGLVREIELGIKKKLFKFQQSYLQASLWAQSKNLPGKFLGSTGAHIMSQEELIGPDKKRQAWAKRVGVQFV